jgi:hypothetical protein
MKSMSDQSGRGFVRHAGLHRMLDVAGRATALSAQRQQFSAESGRKSVLSREISLV